MVKMFLNVMQSANTNVQDAVTKNVSVVTVIIRKRKKYAGQMVKTIITNVRQDVQEWISNAINLANVAVITTRKKKYADQMVKNMITHVRQDVQECISNAISLANVAVRANMVLKSAPVIPNAVIVNILNASSRSTPVPVRPIAQERPMYLWVNVPNANVT